MPKSISISELFDVAYHTGLSRWFVLGLLTHLAARSVGFLPASTLQSFLPIIYLDLVTSANFKGVIDCAYLCILSFWQRNR